MILFVNGCYLYLSCLLYLILKVSLKWSSVGRHWDFKGRNTWFNFIIVFWIGIKSNYSWKWQRPTNSDRVLNSARPHSTHPVISPFGVISNKLNRSCIIYNDHHHNHSLHPLLYWYDGAIKQKIIFYNIKDKVG